VGDREWYANAVDAVGGSGINIGFDWLSKTILSKKSK